MNERIKQIRNENGLTQQEFADRLGIKRGTIANYELGRNEPIDAVITLICREFSVNEVWLRTGKGEMFLTVSRDEQIADFLGDVMRSETDDFRRRLVAVLAKLEPSEWELLEKMALRLAEETKKADQE